MTAMAHPRTSSWLHVLFLLFGLAVATRAISYRCENNQVLIVQNFGNDTIRMHCQRLNLCGHERLHCNYEREQATCGGTRNFVAHVSQLSPMGQVAHTCCELKRGEESAISSSSTGSDSVPGHNGNDCFVYELPDGTSSRQQREAQARVRALNGLGSEYTVLQNAEQIPTQFDGFVGYRMRLFMLKNKSPPTLVVKAIERIAGGYRVTICRPRCGKFAKEEEVGVDVKSEPKPDEWTAVKWQTARKSTWSSWTTTTWEEEGGDGSRNGTKGARSRVKVGTDGGNDGQRVGGGGPMAVANANASITATINLPGSSASGGAAGGDTTIPANNNVNNASPWGTHGQSATATPSGEGGIADKGAESTPGGEGANLGSGRGIGAGIAGDREGGLEDKKDGNNGGSEPSPGRESGGEKEGERKSSNEKPKENNGDSGNTQGESTTGGKEGEEQTRGNHEDKGGEVTTDEGEGHTTANGKGDTGSDGEAAVRKLIGSKSREALGGEGGGDLTNGRVNGETTPGADGVGGGSSGVEPGDGENEASSSAAAATSAPEGTTGNGAERTTQINEGNTAGDSTSNPINEGGNAGDGATTPISEGSSGGAGDVASTTAPTNEGGSAGGAATTPTNEGGSANDKAEADGNNKGQVSREEPVEHGNGANEGSEGSGGGGNGKENAEEESGASPPPPPPDTTAAPPETEAPNTTEAPESTTTGGINPTDVKKIKFEEVPASQQLLMSPAIRALRAMAADPPPAGGGGGARGQCFSGDTVVRTVGGTKLMRELEIGDMVLVPASADSLKYERVEMFYHRDTEVYAKFVQIRTERGKTLSLTSLHLIPFGECEEMMATKLDNKGVQQRLSMARFAYKIKPGDCLLAVDPESDRIFVERIVKVGRTLSKGIYSPMTVEGALITNNILSSCFSQVESHTTQKLIFDVLHAIYSFFGTGHSDAGDNAREIPTLLNYAYLLSNYLLPFAKY